MVKFLASLIFILCSLFLSSQEIVKINGYAYESGNRGYLQGVMIVLEDMEGNKLGTTFSNDEGFFEFSTKPYDKYKVFASKYSYADRTISVNGQRVDDKDEIFLKLEMLRTPGYDFEITLAEASDVEGTPLDGISGARIDVYNNTKEEEVFVLEDFKEPEFAVHLEKGNHYTLLIRKDGYIAKRIEAFVNVNDCILCIEGLGDLSSGVTDNLSGNNSIGVLLANVELEKIRVGKKLEVQNIYYDFGSSRLTRDAKENLNVLVTMMSDTPELLVELGSHTDSRGGDAANMKLSEARAKSAVEYIRNGGIEAYRISARGYGENILKNNCGDGSNCSEEEHAENRRTELKIVGVSDAKARMKSLADIKQAEKAEAMLQEFQFGGQVQIPEGMSIKDLSDEEVNELLDKVQAGQEENEDLQDIEESPEVEVGEIVESIEMEVDENVSQSDKIVSDKSDVEETISNEKEVLESEVEDIVKEAEMLKEIANEEVSEIEESSSNNIQESMSEKLDLVSDPKESQGAEENEENTIESPTVFKVVIYESKEALSEDHNLYTKHSDIIEYFDTDNTHKYLIGSFTEKIKAEKFLKGAVKLAYPDAYVVKFVAGEIIK